MLGFTTTEGETFSPNSTKVGTTVPLPGGKFRAFVGPFHEIKARILLALCSEVTRVDDFAIVSAVSVFERYVRPVGSSAVSQTFHFLGLEIILTDLANGKFYLEVRPEGARLGTTLVCDDAFDGYQALHRILNSQWGKIHLQQLS